MLTAMTYVDLNPIRAKMAKTPEKSDYTSVQQRIQKAKKQVTTNTIPLVPLTNSNRQKNKSSFAFSTDDYLQLVDWAGRAILPNKRGYIESDQPPILNRLNIHSEGFIELMKRTDDLSKLTAIGSSAALTHYLDKLDRKFIKGFSLNRQIFT